MDLKSTKTIGNHGEELACRYLEVHGMKILDRNFRSSSGEIDIIALSSDQTICFIEVKYRDSADNGLPMEAVNFSKQRRICRTSDHYRAKNSLSEELSYRFDVISITHKNIDWIKNAFEYIPRR